MNQNHITTELKRLRADYVAATGAAPFKHFYCPILLEDAPGELCMGHVINECIPDSCRADVLQRKEIDGFFGSLFENRFAAFLEGKKIGVGAVFANKSLSSHLRPQVEVDGTAVGHYFVDKDKSPSHPAVRLAIGSEKFVNIALKLSEEVRLDLCNAQLVMDQNVLPEATATLLKAAHLTMFALFGYSYVFQPTGYDLAKILQNFYMAHKDRHRQAQVDASAEYFGKFAGMIAPLLQYDSLFVRGTIEDRRAIACLGSSGNPFAFGVFVRTGSEMHIVFLPPDNAASMDTYFSFIRDDQKPSFMAKVFEHIEGTAEQPAHWITDKSPPIRMEMAPSQVV